MFYDLVSQLSACQSVRRAVHPLARRLVSQSVRRTVVFFVESDILNVTCFFKLVERRCEPCVRAKKLLKAALLAVQKNSGTLFANSGILLLCYATRVKWWREGADMTPACSPLVQLWHDSQSPSPPALNPKQCCFAIAKPSHVYCEVPRPEAG